MKTKSTLPTTILRVASLLALLQYSAHAFLFLSASLTQGPGQIGTIMASRSHSYWDFYFGYGLLAILSGLIEIALLWQLALLAQESPERSRPIVAVFVFANVAHAVLVWKYFSLVAPVCFDVAIAALLAVAFVKAAAPQETAAARALVSD